MDVIKELKSQGTSALSFHPIEWNMWKCFVKKLVVLVRGKSVLAGELKQIKKNTARKHPYWSAMFDIKKLKDIKGVADVVETVKAKSL